MPINLKMQTDNIKNRYNFKKWIQEQKTSKGTIIYSCKKNKEEERKGGKRSNKKKGKNTIRPRGSLYVSSMKHERQF